MLWSDLCCRNSNTLMNIEKFSGLVVFSPRLSHPVDSKERNVSTNQTGGWLWHYLSSSPCCLLGASLLLSKWFDVIWCQTWNTIENITLTTITYCGTKMKSGGGPSPCNRLSQPSLWHSSWSHSAYWLQGWCCLCKRCVDVSMMYSRAEHV